jgi:hypothetical protein
MKRLLQVSLIAILSTGPSLADSSTSDLPAPAKKLQRDFQKACESALDPLRERYVQDLAKLYDKALKDKNVSEAVVVKHEMNLIIALSMAGEWKEKAGGLLTILPNGNLSHTNGATGTWVIKDDEMFLTWSNGAHHTFPIIATKELLRGRLGDEPVTLTRAK